MNHWQAISNQIDKHHAFNFGGGVQSVAAMVLASQGKIPYATFVFANVGHDSENPATLEYIDNIVKPFMAYHGLAFHEVQRVNRAGEPITLYEHLMSDKVFVPIPARLGSGKPGQRACTSDWKIKVIDKWIKSQFANCIIYQGLGISLDEYQRMRLSKAEMFHNQNIIKVMKYPLIEARITRQDCIHIIKNAGLPNPGKSACYFCPFHSRSAWLDMSVQQPELFQKAVGIEKRINEKRPQYNYRLHGSLLPLEQTANGQMPMFEDDNCESGYCMV